MSTSLMARVRPELVSLRAYSSARMEAIGGSVLLNANESPWPASGVRAQALNRYPDPQPAALSDALSQLYGVPVDNLLVGRGSDEAIDWLTRLFCRAGRDHILISPPTFGMYAVCAGVQGAQVRSVPLLAEQGFAWPHAQLLDAVNADTKLVYVCAPNNPTGGDVDPAQILALAEALAGQAMVVVDEAYVEFAERPSLAPRAARTGNLAVLRTLSKAHALAGARIGTLIADAEVIALARRIMAPYPLPTPCVQAALEVLQPEALAATARRVQLLIQQRNRMVEQLARLPGVDCVHASQANFLTLRLSRADAVYQYLLEQGIVVRQVSQQPGLADCLRISIGSPQENDLLLEALVTAQSRP